MTGTWKAAWIAAAGIAAVAGAPAHGQDSAGDAAVFGARESIEQASLSPDGTRLAYLAAGAGQGSKLMIHDLTKPDSPPMTALVADGNPHRISFCRWTGRSRLMCSVYMATKLDGDAVYASRMIAVDADGRNLKVVEVKRGAGERLGAALSGGTVIDWNPDQEGEVLMTRNYIPETSRVSTRLAQTKSGMGVDRINTLTMAANVLVQPDEEATEYISDGYGSVRIKGIRKVSDATGYAREERRYFYRGVDGGNWQLLSTINPTDPGFDPHAVDRTQNVAYGLKPLNGRMAAYTKALDGSGTETLIFAHPEVDVSGFISVGRRDRVIGVRYVTDQAQAEYFDKGYASMTRALSKAIPGLPLIRVVDTNEDESKLLIWAGSDVDPGRYFLFDRTAKSLNELALVRPQMENRPLGAMKAVSYAARDGVTVPGYLTLPPGKTDAKGLPAIVMPHGGPGSRDEWGFDWMVQYYAAQGYAVLQPNFRGSAGYGDAWFQKNGFQNWQTAINDIIDGARWLLSQGTDQKRLAVVGWSYGGYAALQSAAVDPDLFKAVVAIAPVTDLERLKQDRRNWSDYALVSSFVGSGPHVAEGSPARRAAEIKAPVLLFHGDFDRNVDVGHARLMQSRLQAAGKASELVIFNDRDHYIEDSAMRAEMLAKSTMLFDRAFAGSN